MRVRGRLLTGGFAQALDRWQRAHAEEDAEAAFYALFEALDWAHAADDYVAWVWQPDGIVKKRPWWEWRKHGALGVGDELSDIMQGLRYARNRVHHQWADALVTTDGLTFPIVFPATFRSWAWRCVEDLPTPRDEVREASGREAYSKALAGRPAHATLVTIARTFAFLGNLLDPPIAVRIPPVVMSE